MSASNRKHIFPITSFNKQKTGSELIREKMGASSLEIEKVLLICGEKLTQECPLLGAEAGSVDLNWVG